jgi:hypothetical protein
MKGVETKRKLSAKQCEDLLETLQARFEKNMNRHKGLPLGESKGETGG